MSVLSGNSNTNLSTILYGTNKTVQEVYFGNALVWSAQSTSFSFSPTTLYNLSNDGGSVDITFTPGISDYVAGTWPAWVSSVTPTVVSGVTTKITVTYGENSSTSTRDGNLTFFAGGENRTVPMSQQAADVTVTSELNFVGVGGTQKIYITGSFSSWRINSAPLWVDYASSTGTTSPIDITADSNTGSSRGGTISLTVDGHLYSVGVIQAAIEVHKFKINPTPSNATVLIDGQQRTNNEAYFAPTTVIPWSVSASGYETKTGQLTMGYTDYTMDVTLVAATYTLSVSPTSREFDYDEYNSSNGKSISITSNQSWTISVPMGFAISRSTTGSGNATFNVYPTSYNSGTTNKTGTLTITGNDSQFVNVQLTQKALILTIDPTELNVSASGGSYSVSVGDPNNYGWTISSNQSWCSVEPSSGTGNATVAVDIGTNTSSSRSATITLSSSTSDGTNQTCSVAQSAAQAITFSPSSVSFAGTGSEEVIGVNGTFDWWEVTSWPNWCTCEMTTGQSNNPILIEAGANTGSTTRTGTLVVEVDGVAYQIPLSQIAASAVTYNFIVSASPSGCTVLINDSVRTNNTYACPAGTEVRWSVSKSGYETKTGQLTMGYTDYTMNVTLVAATYTLSVNPESLTFNYDDYSTSSKKTISITSNQSWTISVPSGFSMVGSTSGSGNATRYIYPATYNSGSTNKTGILRITGNDSQYVDVSLTQKALIMTLDPTTLSVSASGGSYSVSVGDPNNYGWTISSNQSWCGVSPSSGTGNATVAVDIGTNTSSSRSATITLSSSTSDGDDLTCSVSQSAAQAITFDPPSVSFDGAGSEEVIGINGTFYGWEVTSWPNWCTCEMTSGESNNPILIEAGANTGSTTRTGTLVVEVDGVEYQLPLSQVAASAVTYNFIVSASPSGCTVLINDSVRTNNTFACPAGTEVRWSVSKTGYVTQSGTYPMTAANHTESVTLVAATLTVSTLSGTNSLTFDYDKYGWATGSQFVRVDSNQSWTMTTTGVFRIGSSGATTINGTAGNNTYDIFPASANTGSSARFGTLTVTGTYGGTATLNLTQNYDTTALQSITVKCGTGTGDTDEVGMNDSCSFYEVYAPSGTTATGVTWSIVSMTTPGSCTGQMIDYGGESYYTVIIDGSASIGDKIKIRATSTVNPSIYGEKEVTVTYDAMDIEDLPESVEIDYSDFTYNAGSYVYMGSSYQMQATVNPLTASQDVTWSLKKTNGSTWTDTSKVSITPSGLLTISANSWTQVRVVATCVADDSITDYINMLLNHG